MKSTILLTATLALLTGLASSPGQELKGKKVLYVNSYHAGYSWSDGIEQAIQKVLAPTGAELKTVALDTSRQKSAEHLTQASAECKATIEQWKPDVVIVSDDPAMKAVYATHFQKSPAKFVFCGVNWDASAYGVPADNVTGMLEVCPVKDLLGEMNKLKPGKTVGYLASDAMTPRIDGENCAKLLGTKVESVFAKDFASWKAGFQELQGKADLILIGNNQGIADWDEAAARAFVEANTRAVTGSWHDYLNGLSVVAYNKLASEQGEWAAKSAIQIAKGAAPGSIKLASNQRGELVINGRLAKKAGIKPSFEMLQNAKVIE